MAVVIAALFARGEKIGEHLKSRAAKFVCWIARYERDPAARCQQTEREGLAAAHRLLINRYREAAAISRSRE